jgi:hypothetical protein
MPANCIKGQEWQNDRVQRLSHTDSVTPTINRAKNPENRSKSVQQAAAAKALGPV